MADINIGTLFDEFRSFLEELPSVNIHTNLFTEDVSVADQLLSLSRNTYQELVLFYCLFKAIYVSSVDPECIEFTHTLEALIEVYRDMTVRIKERCDCLEERDSDQGFKCHTRNVGGRGRPKFVVSKNQVEGLKELGFSWTKISTMIGVSRTTLYRQRQELELNKPSNYSVINDEELDVFVKFILDRTPNAGEVMVRGAIRGRGISVQRWRLRDSMQRVDPARKERRKRLRIRRRVYSVPGPNSLWHLDGHHKLIRWRMVIHGAIDGYSRTVVFLRCSTNNEAFTVLGLFEEALLKFNVPHRIRCDHGTENIEVARWMLARHDPLCNPVITGLSVHNQRIERLWRDVGDSFVRHYRCLFYFLEENFLLDPVNEVHLYALHFVFLPRVNRSLEEFVLQWNNHPVRTEHSLSPLQIWMQGIYRHAHSSQPAVQVLLDPMNDPESYGVSDDDPEPELQTNNHVEVPRSSIVLTDQDKTLLRLAIDPLADDGNYGIDLFLQAVQMVTHFIN